MFQQSHNLNQRCIVIKSSESETNNLWVCIWKLRLEQEIEGGGGVKLVDLTWMYIFIYKGK